MATFWRQSHAKLWYPRCEDQLSLFSKIARNQDDKNPLTVLLCGPEQVYISPKCSLTRLKILHILITENFSTGIDYPSKPASVLIFFWEGFNFTDLVWPQKCIRIGFPSPCRYPWMLETWFAPVPRKLKFLWPTVTFFVSSTSQGKYPLWGRI